MFRYLKQHANRKLLVLHHGSGGGAGTGTGAAGDEMRPMLSLPSGVTLKERKALSLRCKVLLMVVLSLDLIVINVYVLFYLMLAPWHPCRFALHLPHTNCRDIDPVAVVALVGGCMSVLMLMREVYTAGSTKLYLMPGEQDVSCYLANITEYADKLNAKLMKTWGVLAMMLEVVIASYNLNPWLHLLVFIPGFCGCWTAAQKYLKV